VSSEREITYSADGTRIILDEDQIRGIQQDIYDSLNKRSTITRAAVLKLQPELSQETQAALLVMSKVSAEQQSNASDPTIVISCKLVAKKYSECADVEHQDRTPLRVYHETKNVLYPNTIDVADRGSNRTIGKLDGHTAAYFSFLLQNERVRIVQATLVDHGTRVQIELQGGAGSINLQHLLRMLPRDIYNFVSTSHPEMLSPSDLDCFSHPSKGSSPVSPDPQIAEAASSMNIARADGGDGGDGGSCVDSKSSSYFEAEGVKLAASAADSASTSTSRPFTRSQASALGQVFLPDGFVEETLAGHLRALQEITEEIVMYIDKSSESIFHETKKKLKILCDVNFRILQEELTGACNKPLSDETKVWCAELCARIGQNHYENCFRKMLPLASVSSCKTFSRKFRAGSEASLAKEAIRQQVLHAHEMMEKEHNRIKLHGRRKGEVEKPLDRFLYTVLVMDGTGITEKFQANHVSRNGKTTGTVNLTGPSKAYQV